MSRIISSIILASYVIACNGLTDSEYDEGAMGGSGIIEDTASPSPSLDCDGDGVDETPRSGANCSACGDTCDAASGFVCGFRGEWGCLRN